MAQVIFLIFYLLLGLVLAIPYCLLAGWSPEHFPIVIFVAPAFLFIWLMFANFADIFNPRFGRLTNLNWRAAFSGNNHQAMQGSLIIFWGWTFYSFLPIILHWSSVFLKQIGYERVGVMIYSHRYASPVYVFGAVIIVLLIILIIGSVWEAVKNKNESALQNNQ